MLNCDTSPAIEARQIERWRAMTPEEKLMATASASDAVRELAMAGLRLRHPSPNQRCGLRYSVGGSLASTLQGEPRSTLDVDVLVELPADRVDALVRDLGADFFVDHDSVARAVRQGTSVNIQQQLC